MRRGKLPVSPPQRDVRGPHSWTGATRRSPLKGVFNSARIPLGHHHHRVRPLRRTGTRGVGPPAGGCGPAIWTGDPEN